MDSASGITTKYHYDLIGRLGKVTHNGTNFSHTSEYGYNAQGNLEQLFDTILGSTYKSYYYYDTDNRISQVYDGGVKEDYTYDNAGRVTQKKSYINKTKHVLTESFTYQARTSRVSTLTNDSAGDYNVTLTYDYDANGNITSVSDGTHTTRYEYDNANQLTRENNQAAGKTWTWTYDNAGNITSRKEYAYTTATSPGTATDTVIYTYGDTNGWGDLLTGYDGNAVTSDAIGNTLSDGTRTYTWKHGRQLATTVMDGKTWTYTYNADGMRTKRVSGNTSYTYYYNGDMLRYLDYDSNTTDSSQAAKLYFVLDASGNPIEVSYRPEGSTTTKFYYYVQNLQGDVIALVDSANGNTVVTYTYDAWGNVLNVDGALKTSLGVLNPFRYRGYVYDSETTLYYLQSRYYDPELGRFINADAFASTGQGILGNNMYAYCNNNPVIMIDYSGMFACVATMVCTDKGSSVFDGRVIYHTPIGDDERSLYVVKAGTGQEIADKLQELGSSVIIVEDLRINPDPDEVNIKVYYSYLITNRNTMSSVVNALIEYNTIVPVDYVWTREHDEMIAEWDYHNLLAILGIEPNSTYHVDFNEGDKNKSVLEKAWEYVFE